MRPTHQLTRFLFLRLLGLVYLVTFLSLALDGPALFGSEGLTPVGAWLDRVSGALGSGRAVAKLPGLFWLSSADWALQGAAWLGTALGAAVLLGFANAPMLTVLWLLQLSFVSAGQTWMGFGWETLLLETGFLAIFLASPWDPRPGSEDRAPVIVIWLLRWLVFRLYVGAGLIKIRGDECWRELSCLATHYETQPNPNPLSRWLHDQPLWFHQAGVAWNHVVELLVPFLLIAPRRIRHVAAVLLASFQVMLILSGNLSWLNWLTLTICFACFDDSALRWLPVELPVSRGPSTVRNGVSVALAVVVGALSLAPVANMMSPNQSMNRSYDPLRLVNTYGAFGSVGEVRREIVLEGTADDPDDPGAAWLEYELPCKPGAVSRRPCVISPYHLRLDWQIWFVPLGGQAQDHPWLVHMIWKLLHGQSPINTRLSHDPFPTEPPRAIRVLQYRYAFTEPGTEDWWTRELEGVWFGPVSLEDTEVGEYLAGYGWE